MRCMLTVGGLLLSMLLFLLIHGTILSANVRQVEIEDITDRAVSEVQDTLQHEVISQEGAVLSESAVKTMYTLQDETSFSLPYYQYSNIVILKKEEAGISYAVGICYKDTSVTFVKSEDTISLQGLTSAEALTFQVPLSTLSGAELSSAAVEKIYQAGEEVVAGSELLYTNRNLYDSSNTLLLKKNLLSEKDNYIIDCAISSVLRRNETNGVLSIDVINIDYDQGIVDLCVTQEFKYPNGRNGTITKRESICLKP